jgi:hypothetical protein
MSAREVAQSVPVSPPGASRFDPERDPYVRAVKNGVAEDLLFASYRIHHTAHAALTLQKQIINMTIASIKRGPPRLRMLRAFKRDAEKIAELAAKMSELAASAIEARGAATTGAVHESAVAKPDAQTPPKETSHD